MNDIMCVYFIYIYTYIHVVHLIQNLVHDTDTYIFTTSTLISYMHSMEIIKYNLSNLNGDVKY